MLFFCQKGDATEEQEQKNWISLFDGQSLEGWTNCPHYKSGTISIQDQSIILGKGVMATSIRYTGPHSFPNVNYVIEYTANRRQGNDFFAALTFPVKSGFCTFVNGGWGGSLIGLSSVDGMDASENPFSSSYDFANKKWYHFRVLVTERSVLVSIDGKNVILADIEGTELSTRLEVMQAQPLGLSSWESEGVIREIRYRRLRSDETHAADQAVKKNEPTFSF